MRSAIRVHFSSDRVSHVRSSRTTCSQNQGQLPVLTTHTDTVKSCFTFGLVARIRTRAEKSNRRIGQNLFPDLARTDDTCNPDYAKSDHPSHIATLRSAFQEKRYMYMSNDVNTLFVNYGKNRKISA